MEIRMLILGLGSLALLAVAISMHKIEVEEERKNESLYCEMITLYDFDQSDGVEPNHRRGWPNYKNKEC